MWTNIIIVCYSAIGISSFLNQYYYPQPKKRPWGFKNRNRFKTTVLTGLLLISASEILFLLTYDHDIQFLLGSKIIVLLYFLRFGGQSNSIKIFYFLELLCWFIIALCQMLEFANKLLNLEGQLSQELIRPGHIFLVMELTLSSIMLFLGLTEMKILFTFNNYNKLKDEKNSISIFSQLTFSWMNELMKQGFVQDLSLQDLRDSTFKSFDKCNVLLNKFEKYWRNEWFNSENRKGNDRSLIPALWKTFQGSLIIISTYKMISDILLFLSPLILRELIELASSDSRDIWSGYKYAGALLFTTSLQTLIISQYYANVLWMGMSIRAVFTGMIYKKILLMPAYSRNAFQGSVINLISVDAQRFVEFASHVTSIWSIPLQIVISTYFLYDLLGPAGLAGIALMFLMIPINVYVASRMSIYQSAQMEFKDQRAKLLLEIFSGIKRLKCNAWEVIFENKVNLVRNKELEILLQTKYLDCFVVLVWTCAPLLVSLATFSLYVFLDDQNILDAKKAFVSLSLFNILKSPLTFFPIALRAFAQAKVSLERMTKFMNISEGHYLKQDASSTVINLEKFNRSIIEVVNCSFSWNNEDDPVLKEISLKIKKGDLIAIVGKVGSGKSSFLSAIAGEMKLDGGNVHVWGDVRLVPQQTWLQSGTIRENVLFGQDYIESKYNSVLQCCALESDLQLMSQGDLTDIGERGVALSGGQRQRVSLARAVYNSNDPSDIYLLDDPLSALDSVVAQYVFTNVISHEGLLRNHTRLWVTNDPKHLPDVDLVVILVDGKIAHVGTYYEIYDKLNGIQYNPTFNSVPEKNDFRQLENHSNHLNYPLTSESQKCRNIEDFSMAKGQIYKYFIQAMGILNCVICFIFQAFFQGFCVGSGVWLSYWAASSEHKFHSSELNSNHYYVSFYAIIGLGQVATAILGSAVLHRGTLNASTILHKRMLQKVLGSPLQFFEVTPIGEIMNRFSKDVDTIDCVLQDQLRDWIECFLLIIGTLGVVTFTSPMIVLALVPMGYTFYVVMKYYVKTSTQLRRLESESGSRVYSHADETFRGSIVIRAFKNQSRFIDEACKIIDDQQLPIFIFIASTRWLGVRLEMLGNLLTFATALFSLLMQKSAGVLGLTVSFALQLTEMLSWFVRMTCELESNAVAVGRIREYEHLKQETDGEMIIHKSNIPKEWPLDGSIKIANLKCSYSKDILALKGINCTIQPGEKIGIIGRTGSGKSTLVMSLLRLIEPVEGNIVIDGIDIANVPLRELRSRLVVVAQDPILFADTIRSNLDPFVQHSDNALWDVLERVHMKRYFEVDANGLETKLDEAGSNLSFGQKQLIILAQCFLRKPKILILDEATASVDLQTEKIIQDIIHREFQNCTILTVAHRLATVKDCDRILVMENGNIIKTSSPKEYFSLGKVEFSHSSGLTLNPQF